MPDPDLVKTGIAGLDDILPNGIPRGNVILVEGAIGAGKTTIGVEFVYRGASQFDEPGIIVVFEVSPDKIMRDALGLGWDLRKLEELRKLKIVFTTREVLRQELAPAGVGVTTVHPGGIKTRIAETARVAAGASAEEEQAGKEAFAKLLTFPADRAAAQILDAAHRRRARLVITPEAVAADVVSRLFPSNYFAVLNRLRPGATRNATAARTAAAKASVSS